MLVKCNKSLVKSKKKLPKVTSVLQFDSYEKYSQLNSLTITDIDKIFYFKVKY